MTMLDRMRRHKNWLKWSLGLVCLTFILFYIPDFLRSGAGTLAGSNDTIARVEGRDITAGDFRRTYQAQLAMYRGAYGGQMNERLLKQLGIDQQILQPPVDHQRRGVAAGRERLDQDLTALHRRGATPTAASSPSVSVSGRPTTLE